MAVERPTIADEIGWRPSNAARSLTGSRSQAVGLQHPTASPTTMP